MENRSIYDQRLTEMLDKVADEIKNYSISFISHIKKLAEIGISLTSEKNITKILEMIVEEAKNFTNADAGTLYSVSGDRLIFEILYNDTLGIKQGGTTGTPIKLPPVPIHEQNVSGYVAKKGEIINIPDVYKDNSFDFTGPKKYDAQTGYRSRSFLVVPLRDHENTIIGVLQLINAKNKDTGEVIPFAPEYEDIIYSLASQAAVAITNAQLIKDIEQMLNSFVKVMATAIDERTPYNRDHTARVACYTVALASRINEISEGKYKDLYFTEEKLAELNMAAWLHDVGKVTTPDIVMDKSTKLECKMDRLELILQRIELLRKDCSLQELSGTLDEKKAKEMLERLSRYEDFLIKANQPAESLNKSDLALLDEIRAFRFKDHMGIPRQVITEEEYTNLSIPRGTLNPEERAIMENHVLVTEKLLTNMPFIKKYKNVPEIASSHHEKIDGSGYPHHLKGEEIPIGGKIMAIADFFDALTASDRPYKKAMTPDQAFEILEKSAERGEVDKELLQIFRDSKIYATDTHKKGVFET
ncbi:GAF domain-containing protein [Candidatus Mcinerneyibacteriota bacterium]|nr:GAF domain-containing protein [Candidatus Mcinerneyibacteriota bacterium]